MTYGFAPTAFGAGSKRQTTPETQAIAATITALVFRDLEQSRMLGTSEK